MSINKNGRIVIIDPSSAEIVRGAFCFAPYLLHNGFRERGEEVTIMEHFIPEDYIDIPLNNVDHYVITIWSYSQIEAAMFLAHLPEIGEKICFAGYTPLIHHLALPHIEARMGFDPLSDVDFLKGAMVAYPKYFSDFRRLLTHVYDCDMHLSVYDSLIPAHPIHTAYGCENNCAFCPATVNSRLTRTELAPGETIRMLEQCEKSGVRRVHFTDEDFFHDIERAYAILQGIKHLNFRIVAMASPENLLSYISTYGLGSIISQKVELVEVGLETADDKVSHSMGGAKVPEVCRELGKIDLLNILWLTLTFFPGETIHSLNITGRFLRKYGFNPKKLMPRLRGNGTWGGLGQFFQPYHGTRIVKRLNQQGRILNNRPSRMFPGYLPTSFLQSTISRINWKCLEQAIPWLSYYGVLNELKKFKNIARVGRVLDFYLTSRPEYQQGRWAIMFAILARMEVIK